MILPSIFLIPIASTVYCLDVIVLEMLKTSFRYLAVVVRNSFLSVSMLSSLSRLCAVVIKSFYSRQRIILNLFHNGCINHDTDLKLSPNWNHQTNETHLWIIGNSDLKLSLDDLNNIQETHSDLISYFGSSLSDAELISGFIIEMIVRS